MNSKVSIIIPTYNEEDLIEDCIDSLSNQSYMSCEIIIVDDGSIDNTLRIIKNLEFKIKNLKVFHQKHQGPGPARNLGASNTEGEILVFVDADMTFDKNFIRDLTNPIIKGTSIGTFSKNEMVANYDNIWSICWNINRNVPIDRMLPKDYPDEAPVFRGILKKEFDKVRGFDATGEYTDDWSLSRKLKVMSTAAPGAIYYHFNPSNLKEVYKQARWIGKNEFISGNIIRRIKSLILYSLPISLIIGFFKASTNFFPSFVIFKLVYDTGIFISVVGSILNEKKAK